MHFIQDMLRVVLRAPGSPLEFVFILYIYLKKGVRPVFDGYKSRKKADESAGKVKKAVFQCFCWTAVIFNKYTQ